MKNLLITIALVVAQFHLEATDPIKSKGFYFEVGGDLPIYHHYNQVLFTKVGLTYGGYANFGYKVIPLFVEINTLSTMTFKYSNNEVAEQLWQIGIMYNLNNLTYLIPYGIDPYVGIGWARRKSQFSQYSIQEDDNIELLSQYAQKSNNYKFSSGVKFGNKKIVIGFHYDFIPSQLSIPQQERQDLTIHNSLHLFSIRAGIRLNTTRNNKIRCPKFKSKQKKSLAF